MVSRSRRCPWIGCAETRRRSTLGAGDAFGSRQAPGGAAGPPLWAAVTSGRKRRRRFRCATDEEIAFHFATLRGFY